MSNHLKETDAASDQSDWRIWRVSWLNACLSDLKPMYREVLLASFAISVLALAVPVFVLQVYDRVVYHAGMSTLQSLLIGMVFVLAFDFVLRRARSRLLQKSALSIDSQLRNSLFDRIMALPMRTLESRPTVFWQGVFRDADTVRNALSGPSAVLIFDLPFAVLFLIMVMVIAWPVAWVLLLILIGFLVLAWRSNRAVASATETERTEALKRDTLIGELMAGRAAIKAGALDQKLKHVWEEREAAAVTQSLKRGDKTDGYSAAAQTLVMLSTVGMTGVGAVAIMQQNMTIGMLIAANLLAGRLLGPLSQLVSLWRTATQVKDAVHRLSDVLDPDLNREQSAVALPRPVGRLEMDTVSFAYSEDKPPVLTEIKIDIRPGGLIAVIGPNGSGKTTFLKVLQGLYRPQSGRVLLDGADMEQFGRRDLSKWIGSVPQDNTLFSGSIRDNLTFGSPDATDDEIIRAARLASAHDRIIDLPDGYGTEVGERGSAISTGLRQRIVIARALIGDPPILLMDEPTSHLDQQAEAALAESLSQLAADHTIIVVTHSPILLDSAAQAIALERGRVRVAGPREAVLQFISERGNPNKNRNGAAPQQQVVRKGPA